jgi:hypothetical protein
MERRLISWLSALLQTFLTTSSFYATFSDRHRDFLGRVRAFRAIISWNMNMKQALAFDRYILGAHVGHLATLTWIRRLY